MKKYLAVLVVLKELLEIITLPFFKIKGFILEVRLKKAEKNLQESKQDLHSFRQELEDKCGTSDLSELSAQCETLKKELSELEQGKDLEAGYEEQYISYSQYLSSLLVQLSALENEKTNLEESHGILAIEFFDQYREGLDMIEDASLKSVYEELSADERIFWGKRCNELQLLSDQKLAILKKISSPEAFHVLETANANWNKTIAPLIKNRLYAKIKFEEEIYPNMLDELRSNEPGNELLRDIIKNNPDLLKDCINQQYSDNLSDLLTCDTYIQQYLDKMPEDFQEALKNYREKLMG